jgi:hypothetical protein
VTASLAGLALCVTHPPTLIAEPAALQGLFVALSYAKPFRTFGSEMLQALNDISFFSLSS